MRAQRWGAVVIVTLVASACGPSRARPIAIHHEPAPTTTTVPPATAAISPTSVPPARPPRHDSDVRLVSYGSCTAFLAAVKQEALAELVPYGWRHSGGPYMASGVVQGGAAAAASSGASSASTAAPADATGSGAGYSTTNNQEAGVDEPDLAKTDGHLLLTVRRQPVGIQVADVGASPPRLRGFLALPQVGYPAELFLVGHDAVVVGGAAGVQPMPAGAAPARASAVASGGPAGAEPYRPATDVAVVSLDDPDHPHVVRSFELDGDLAGARLISGRIALVLRGQPSLNLAPPAAGDALARNQAAIRSSTIADWLPSVTSRPAGVQRRAACANAMHPVVASGVGTVSVVSIDPNSDIPGTETTVVGDASVVYASTAALYVATTSWRAEAAGAAALPDPSIATQIHGFDLANPAAPRYIGSGQVPGTVTDQYALSEYAGDLRVATTVGRPTPPPFEGAPPAVLSDNRVTVLRATGGQLVAVGQLTGLGAGEKIFGVRFIGAIAYVVTFRQTDPLYVVDLSQPTHPALRGQLELTGYSAYLHPIGGGLLLGVGEAVDSNARRVGLQTSVFDVADLSHPALRSRDIEDNTYSPAENDHHAFLWWAPRRLLVVPVVPVPGVYQTGSRTSNQTGGVMVFSVGSDGTVTRVGAVQQPQSPYGWGVERAVVVGDLLYTVSDAGILASRLDTLSQVAWLPYAGQS